MDHALGGQLDPLEGDQEEVTSTDAQGVLHCNPHHDDWDGVDWYEDNGVNRSSGGVPGCDPGYSCRPMALYGADLS